MNNIKWLDKATTQSILAFIFVLFALVIFAFIVFREIGGDNALFLVIGYIAAWAQMVAIYYFRKKPPQPPEVK